MRILPEMSITPQRFHEIRIVFEALVVRSQAERIATLQSLHDRDPEMAREVESLIAAYDRRTTFFETPIELFGYHAAASAPQNVAGTLIGHYRLLEVVGEGGMGQVWRAEQTEPVSRIVALKLIRAGMDTHEVVSRFESERQALAVMDHPAIAKVFDAGSTPAGRPYFAMEFVEGISITSYCDQHVLSVRQRLDLFMKVCEGIQHAHLKAIIHRDIKPSNVLVAEVDGSPVPKIIDFGVARAISSDTQDDNALTRIGSILGTPNYMSPEQAASGSGSLDTRTDVYSLGTLLYELLVGTVPHDVAGLPLIEILRKIRDEAAQRPSVRYRLLGMDAETARKRRTTPSALCKELSGDLDTVVLKALKRNPDNRYGSPSELAADLARYVRHEAVTARPPNPFYLARKYVRRHRMGVAVVIAAVAVLTAFSVWQSIELHRITRERDRADNIARFMTEMFQVSDPSESRGNRITAREILDRSSTRIDKGLAGDPEMQAKLNSVMGRVYYGLGLYGQAEILFRHSLDSMRRTAGRDSLDTAQSAYDLAMALRANGNRDEAKKLDVASLDVREHRLGQDHPDTLKSMNSLAADLEREGSYSEARRLQETVYRADLRILGPEHSDTLVAMKNLGELLYSEGRLRESEEYARAIITIQRRKLGSDHPDTLDTIHLLAAILSDEGRYPEAEKLFRELLVTRTRVLGPNHPDTIKSMKALAVPLNWEGRFAEAEQLDRQVVEKEEAALGPHDPGLLLAMSDLAHILGDEGKHDEAEDVARKVVKISERTFGADNARTLFFAGSLSSILLGKGSLDEAERLASRTRAAQVRILGRDHAQTALTTYTLARIDARRGEAEQAVKLLRESVEHGLNPKYMRNIERDTNLKSLRADIGFQSLVADVRRRLAAAGNVATGPLSN